MSQTSEDKSLPASSKKLADARRKGQVAHSRDLVTVVGLVAGFLYLAVEGPAIMEAFRAILTEPIALTAKPPSQSPSAPQVRGYQVIDRPRRTGRRSPWWTGGG